MAGFCGGRLLRGGFWGLVLALLLGWSAPAWAQMKSGREMKDFALAFKLTPDAGFKDLRVTLIETNAPGCMYYPQEKPELTFQLENLGDKPLKISGRCDFVNFATLGIPGDIWLPQVVVLRELAPFAVEVEIPAKGFQNIVLRPQMPEEKGGYGLVLDLGEHGRDFIAGLARVFRPAPQRLQYPKQSLDKIDPAVLERLGVQAMREEWPYVHTAHRDYEPRMKQLASEMALYKQHNVTVALQFGAGSYNSPLNDDAPRTYLDSAAVMKGGKGDFCWMPEDDADFEEYVYRILCEYGWPKGQVTAVMLWNEPWEGVSISGWGADMNRYRSIYRHMANAVLRAEKDAGVDVLVGGGDSSTNAWDKLFGDGSAEFLPIYDFCSIHYQGMSAPVLHKLWNERKDRKGRVLIWDTESWVANTDDRIAGLVASNRAAGYDRSVGVFYGNICTQLSHGRIQRDKIRVGDGTAVNIRPLHAWPAAATMSAVQHFIGEREFSEILIKNALPWIYSFAGLEGNPDDGTVVVVGDIGQLFDLERVLYRNVRPLAEVKRNIEIHRTLQGLAGDDPQREALEKQLKTKLPFSGVSLSLAAAAGEFALYDFYGNRVAEKDGRIVIPLDARGFFLRADPAKKGSYARLLAALREARMEGLQPVEIIARDMLAPLASRPALRLSLRNMLNRPVSGSLRVTMPGLDLEAPQTVELAPYESREIVAMVLSGKENADNTYPLAVEFDAGGEGQAVLYEDMRVNLIGRAKVVVDGNLDDWKGGLPQIVRATERATRSLTEAAWLPFVPFEAGAEEGYAVGYLAYDADYFYFAAKVADSTPCEGTLRFGARDDEEFFYPEVSYRRLKEKGPDGKERDIEGKEGLRELKWKEGVPRYTYRKGPVLPCGSAPKRDNIQIAFNAVADADENDWDLSLPGRMPRFIYYKCTDYEYALNTVAQDYGGGHEVWRMLVPGMVRKHFYPRQPKCPQEGAVETAKLVTVHANGTRITEAAIPWSELPDVKRLLDAGQTVRFSFRVNDNGGGPLLELARERSVSRVNCRAFHPDWQIHWANEVEFAFEK